MKFLILVSLVLSAFAEPEAEGDANHHFVRHWNGALVPQDTAEVVAQKQLHFNAHATAAVHGFKHPYNVYGYWPQVPAAVVPKVEVKAVEQPEVQKVVTHPNPWMPLIYTIPGLTKPVTQTVEPVKPVVQTAYTYGTYPYTYGTYPYTYGYTHHMGKREAEGDAEADAEADPYYYYNQAYPYSNYYGYNRHFNYGYRYPSTYGFYARHQPVVTKTVEPVKPVVQTAYTMPFYTIPGLTKPVTKTVEPVAPVVQTAYPYTYGTYPYTYGYTHHMGKREAEGDAEADPYYYYNHAYPYSNYFGNRHFNFGYRYPSTYTYGTYGTYGYPYAYGK